VPGDKTVGSVSVRVLPDTSRFKRELEAELAKIGDVTVKVDLDLDRRTFDAQLEKLRATDITIKADVDVDQDQVGKALAGKKVTVPTEADVDQFIKDIEKHVRDSAGVKIPPIKIPPVKDPIKVPVEIDFDKLSADARIKEALAKKAGLRVVKVNADIAEAQAKLAVLDGEFRRLNARPRSVTVAADVASAAAKIADLKLRLATLRDARVKIDADASSALRAAAEASAALAAIPNRKKIKLEVDGDPFKRMLRGIASDVGSAVGGAFSSAGQAVSGLGRSLGDVASTAGPLVLTVAKIGVAGFAVAEAGAAITVAWGAASTAIAAVPAAIGLVAAPLAAAALGMDGIKRAAKTIAPQFNKLKSAVSNAFEKGLTPVLKTIGNELFPKLAVGLSGTATALSKLATGLGDFVTRGAGLGLLSTAIGNINAAIGRVNLVPLVEGFLRLTGNNAALQALVTTINGVGTALNSISLNADLDGAFQALGETLRSLTAGFAGLVNNGITVFKNAAPGVKKALDGISDFFGKFDYERLGKAAGNAIGGIGDALKKIPQGTVDGITSAFERLGTTLSGPEIQNGLAALARLIPPAVDAINSLAKALAARAVEVDNFADFLNDPVDFFSATGKHAAKEKAQFKNYMDGLAQGIADGRPGVVAEAEKLGPELSAKVQVAAQNIQSNRIPAAFKEGITPLGGIVRGAFGEVPAVTSNELGKIPGITRSAVGKTVGLFGTGLGQLSPQLQAELGILPGQAQTSLAPLAPAAGQSVAAMTAAVDASIPGLGTAFATGFTNLGPLVDTAFQALTTTNIATGLQGMATAITTGFPALIGTAFTTGFVAAVFPAVDQAFAGLGVSVTMGMVNLGTAITAAIPVLGTAFTAGFVAAVYPAVDQAFAGLGVTVTMGMVNLGLAVTAGMTSISTAFTTGFVGIQASITTALTGIAASIVGTMTGVTTAVTAGMSQANAAIQAGTSQMSATLAAAGQGLVTNIRSTMDQFVAAVRTGGQQAVDALKQVGERMKTAIPANILEPVGRQISAGLAKGIAAGGSAVTAAAVKVVQDAAAAANSAAQINSPSRVWMLIGRFLTKGLALGITSETDVVVRAVEAMMGTAAASVPQLSAALDEALSANDFTAGLHQKVAVSGGPDVAGTVASAGDIYNFTTVPDATARQLADEVSFRRRTARRGVHAGR
jgi:hypothetical protein